MTRNFLKNGLHILQRRPYVLRSVWFHPLCYKPNLYERLYPTLDKPQYEARSEYFINTVIHVVAMQPGAFQKGVAQQGALQLGALQLGAAQLGAFQQGAATTSSCYFS
jgi:hypothetical protein